MNRDALAQMRAEAKLEIVPGATHLFDFNPPSLGMAARGAPMQIAPLSPKQAAQAGRVLAASHADYPSFRYLFPDAAVRCGVLRIFMVAAARDAARYGHALVAHDDHRFLGVALWMPPGGYPLSLGRQLQMMPALLAVAVIARAAFWPFARVGATLETSHPDNRAWYLQALGVHPQAQRRGVGRQLLAPVLALADATGLECRLHTSDPANVEYYRRFGFEVSRRALHMFPEGPSYISMVRPAHARPDSVPVASTPGV